MELKKALQDIWKFILNLIRKQNLLQSVTTSSNLAFAEYAGVFGIRSLLHLIDAEFYVGLVCEQRRLKLTELKKLELTRSYEHEFKIMEQYIAERSVADNALQILEAGCGQKWSINLDRVEYILTGVDLDKAALELRMNVVNDLDEIIQGDLVSVALSESHYDVIYNAFVLEHINGAENVLNNFIRWLKPGGLWLYEYQIPIQSMGTLLV